MYTHFVSTFNLQSMDVLKKATRRQTKIHNTRLILKTIYQHGEMSRADIARATRLARPTVSNIVADLIEDKLVVETGRGSSAGGKRPTLINVDHKAHQLLCVDLGSQEFRGAIVDLRGEIIERISFPTHHKVKEDAIQLVYTLIDVLTETATAPLLGMGIGITGLTDSDQGIIRHSVNLGWVDLPLKSLLENRYRKPVHVANDSHMAALAEYTFGETRGSSNNLIAVKVGQGISAGIIIHGQPYYGDGFGAGEIGHVVVAKNAALCACGHSGCLETISSTRAIVAKAQEISAASPDSYLATVENVDWDAILDALDAGDEAVQEMIAETERYLGVAIANLIGCFNIHHIIIFGRVSSFGDVFLSAVRNKVQQLILPELAASTEISLTTLSTDIVILGCSAMILYHELGVV